MNKNILNLLAEAWKEAEDQQPLMPENEHLDVSLDTLLSMIKEGTCDKDDHKQPLLDWEETMPRRYNVTIIFEGIKYQANVEETK